MQLEEKNQRVKTLREAENFLKQLNQRRIYTSDEDTIDPH